MTRDRRVTLAKVGILLGVVPALLWAYEYGPNPGYVGIPGENGGANCATAGCHTGTANTFSGSVAVTFPNGMTYTPGVAQQLTVTISDPATTQKAWGFELSAREASSVSTMAGTFAATDANTQLMCSETNLEVFIQVPSTSPQTCKSGYTLQYMEHSLTGYNNSVIAGHNNGSYSYSISWTPPATNVGNVTVYVAGNAGVGNPPTQTGDHVYTKTYTLTPASAGGGSTPQISSGGVVSAGAFGGFSAATSGSWIEIYGSNLAPDTRSWAGSDFNGNNAPTSLDGVSVTVNGLKAYVDYISPTQVNVEIPANAGAGAVPVILTTNNTPSNTYSLTLNATEPGFLAPSGGVFVIGNKQYIVAQHQNGTFVAPSNDASLGTPAKPGETLVIYGVGFGSAKDSSGNTIPFGQIVTATNQLSTPLQVAFNNTQATLNYYGLAPNFVGLYQFNVVVPTSIANNDAIPVTFNLGGNTGSQTLYTAVHN